MNEIELRLAEFSNGDWTEAELKDRLQQYRRVMLPLQGVSGVLWSVVCAPCVYVASSGTHAGYYETMNPKAVLPAPIPKLEASPLAG